MSTCIILSLQHRSEAELRKEFGNELPETRQLRRNGETRQEFNKKTSAVRVTYFFPKLRISYAQPDAKNPFD